MGIGQPGQLTSGATGSGSLSHVDGGGGCVAGRRGRWVGAGIAGDVELVRLGVQDVHIGIIDGSPREERLRISVFWFMRPRASCPPSPIHHIPPSQAPPTPYTPSFYFCSCIVSSLCTQFAAQLTSPPSRALCGTYIGEFYGVLEQCHKQNKVKTMSLTAAIPRHWSHGRGSAQ